VKSAEETKSVVDKELADLEKTLANIQDARAFDELTVVSRNLGFVLGCRWMLIYATGGGRCRSARHRQAHRAARIEGSLGRSRLQGKSHSTAGHDGGSNR
jgi:hypothetical protein